MYRLISPLYTPLRSVLLFAILHKNECRGINIIFSVLPFAHFRCIRFVLPNRSDNINSSTSPTRSLGGWVGCPPTVRPSQFSIVRFVTLSLALLALHTTRVELLLDE